jgi:hypothetical protein
MKFLEVMLGDRPALSPVELTYQRMLAGDPIEATEQAETFLKDKPLIAYYKDILLGGLRLAHADLDEGRLDDERLHRIRDTVADIVDDLKGHQDPELPDVSAADGSSPLARLSEAEEDAGAERKVVPLPERWRKEGAVLCIPGSGLLDEALAIILAQLMDRQGIPALAKEADALSMAKLFALDTKDTALVCLCYIRRASTAQFRYAARRIRRKAPGAAILVFTTADGSEPQQVTRLPEGFEVVEGSLDDAVTRVKAIAAKSRPELSSAETALSRAG